MMSIYFPLSFVHFCIVDAWNMAIGWKIGLGRFSLIERASEQAGSTYSWLRRLCCQWATNDFCFFGRGVMFLILSVGS